MTKKDLAVPLLDIYLNKLKILNQNDTYIHMFIVVLFTIAKIWKQPTCPSIDEWIQKWYIYTMKYDSVLKMNEILPSATTWSDLECICAEWNKSDRDRQMSYDFTYMLSSLPDGSLNSSFGYCQYKLYSQFMTFWDL